MIFYRGEAKRLRAAGEKLGREKLAERALEIVVLDRGLVVYT